jgi:hypothetical protein
LVSFQGKGRGGGGSLWVGKALESKWVGISDCCVPNQNIPA